MLKIRDAKPLFAVSVLLAPWDILVFGQRDTWGTTFVFGRYVRVQSETQLLNPLQLYQAYSGLGASGDVGRAVTAVWALCSLAAVIAAAYVVYRRRTVGTTTVRDDRVVGAVFAAAGGVFLLSRLVVTLQNSLDWTSVPIGALYVVFVGGIFYFGLFRLGSR